MCEIAYSPNWKDLGTVLAYLPNGFTFYNSVIIIELDDCFTGKITINRLYDTRNATELTFDERFIKKIKADSSADNAIVLLSNQNSTNKLTIDSAKLKFEKLQAFVRIPILAFFALKNNSFSKPHTGLYRLLSAYYWQKGNQAKIQNVTVVSNQGGTVVTKTKDSESYDFVTCSDRDRAFAHNIDKDFKTVDEYLEEKYSDSRLLAREKTLIRYEFSKNIIPPETRQKLVAELNKSEDFDLFKHIESLRGKDSYVIFVLGPPKCGKTTLVRKIISQWRKSEMGYFNAIVCLDGSKDKTATMLKVFKKTISDRISIIIDGGCGEYTVRNRFIKACSQNIGILYIAIGIGIEMAKVLNHVAIEESKDESLVLNKDSDFYIYRSKYVEPIANSNSRYIIYRPKIEPRDTIMKYRY
jgi:adenylate kinase family enzyme